MRTIAVLNQKGGVGKTSTAHAIGTGLARRGYRVLFLDLDGQGNLTYILKGQTSGETVITLLNQLLESGSCNPERAIQHTETGDLIASSPALTGADTVLADVTGREYKIKELLAPLQSLYDYCIIDTPPTLGTLTINALTASTDAIAPAQADMFSLTGLAQLHTTIETVKRYCNPSIAFRGVVLTRYSSRAVISREVADKIAEVARQYGAKLYSSKIRECTAVKEAQLTQTDIYSYAPKSNATADYTALVNEIIAEER